MLLAGGFACATAWKSTAKGGCLANSRHPATYNTATAVRKAVARTFAQIMAERHPGTRWLPIERSERDATSRTGEFVVVDAVPHDVDPIRDRPSTATTTSDVHHVDR